MMNTIPVKDGKKCVYRVVRVSGTIRKAEEEAIRRAREIMLRAKRELGEQSAATLESILGKPKDNRPVALDSEVLMLDASDDDPMGYSSDDDG
jgi:ribonuclease P/MRP protein subunit POP5